MSYYSDAPDGWNSTPARTNSTEEQECKRCHGLGTDAEGADCVYCDGMGSVFLR